MPSPQLVVYAVASRYAWDVVESCWRIGRDPVCIDNIGGADPELPALGRDGARGTFVLGLSSADGRLAAARSAALAGYDNPFVLMDPTATVARTATLSHGVYVNAGAVVGAKSLVGCQSNINRSASIGHDNRLATSVSIGPGAVLAGSVSVGEVAFIGAGATVLPGVMIGRRAIIGAGAVVASDVAAGEVVVGNPARVIRTVALPDEDDACPHCSTN